MGLSSTPTGGAPTGAAQAPKGAAVAPLYESGSSEPYRPRARMWVPAGRSTCRLCGDRLPRQKHQGMPRRWCSEACRLKAYRERKQAATSPTSSEVNVE